MESLEKIASKFGGSSMADERSIYEAAQIVRSDPRRCRVIVSTLGKSRYFPDRNEKVTDLLEKGRIAEVEARFRALGIALGIEEKTEEVLQEMMNGFNSPISNNPEWRLSRGEWVMAQLFAEYIGGVCIDAEELILFHTDGRFNKNSYPMMKARLRGLEDRIVVMGGFFGKDSRGRTRTFPRGGGDISGAHMAVGTNAVLYEIWSDANGLLTADPDIVDAPDLFIDSKGVLAYKYL